MIHITSECGIQTISWEVNYTGEHITSTQPAAPYRYLQPVIQWIKVIHTSKNTSNFFSFLLKLRNIHKFATKMHECMHAIVIFELNFWNSLNAINNLSFVHRPFTLGVLIPLYGWLDKSYGFLQKNVRVYFEFVVNF